MASSLQFLFLFLFPLTFQLSHSHSLNPTVPKAAIFPVRKDPSTLQYVSHLLVGRDPTPVDLVLDLNGPIVWADCGSDPSLFGSQKPIGSCSLKCSMATPNRKGGCHRSSGCTLPAENAFSGISAAGEMVEDDVALEFWDGVNSNSLARSEEFLFSCAPAAALLGGLAGGAKGVFGLGNSRVSLPSQIITAFGVFERKFSLCLSPESHSGALFLGGGPISSTMVYTPLITKDDGNYYVGLSSIKVSGARLSLKRKGSIETRLSTVTPYTVMESGIYATFIEAYVEAAKEKNLTLVGTPVAPFEVCFGSEGAERAPGINLVLQSEMVKWRVHGKNSMVFVSDEIMCLGFLDGGVNPKDLVVIGGYQMEDCLLEFNLGNSMLGISPLAVAENRCSDFAALRRLRGSSYSG